MSPNIASCKLTLSSEKLPSSDSKSSKLPQLESEFLERVSEMKLQDWGFHFAINRCINESFIARKLSSREGDDLELFEARFRGFVPGYKRGAFLCCLRVLYDASRAV